MYKQSVRRRRAVLAALVAFSLVLLTAYFGESAGGGLHSVQRGVLEVLAPVQEGASRALKPFRDLFGWFGDTLGARDERDKLKKERNELRQQVIGARAAERENAQLRRLVGLDKSDSLDGLRRRSPRASSAARRPSGTPRSRSTRAARPACASTSRWSTATASSARSTAVTGGAVADHADHRPRQRRLGPRAHPGRHRPGNGITGVVQPAVGRPLDLLLEFLPRRATSSKGDTVVTAGSQSDRARVAVPAEHPDRPRDQGRRPRSCAGPARAHRAVRRPAPPRLRPDPHRGRGRAASERASATP